MREEIQLLLCANQAINRSGLDCAVVAGADPIHFKDKHVLNRAGLMFEMTAMSPATYGETIALALGPYWMRSEYRVTPVSALSPEGEFVIKWTGRQGADQLLHMAKMVVIACMYDILRAEWWWRVDQEKRASETVPTLPKSAMILFVKAHRMKGIIPVEP